MAIDSAAYAVMFVVVPAAATLLLSILLYRLAFRKKTRMRANTYTWLITVGFGVVLEIVLFLIFKQELQLQFIGVIFMAPGVGIGFPSLWSLIRFIYIKATPKKERHVVQKTPEPKLG